MSGKKSSKRKNTTEIRLLDTKFGVKVLVKQGENRVWLNQRHIITIITAVVGRAFEERSEDKDAVRVRN